MTRKSGTLLVLVVSCAAARGQWQQTAGPGRAAADVVGAHAGRLQLGVRRHGVYLSTDHGATWQAGAGTGGTAVLCFASNGGALFAGMDTLYGPGGVYRSTDGGATWQASSQGLGNRRVQSLLANGTTIFAGDSATGVYRSTDDGATWAPSNIGIQTESIGALARTSTRLLAAGYNNLYESTNGGTSWQFTSTGQYFPIAGMAAFGQLVVAGGFQGLIRSTDGGQTFSNRIDVPFIGSLDRLTSFVLDGSRLYASTISSPGSGGSGVVVSTDQGANWVPTQSPVPRIAVGSLALDGGTLVAAAPDKGPILSTDGGATFARSVAGLPYGGSVRALARTANLVSLHGDLFAGTQGDGVYRSRDVGASWQQASSEPSGQLQHQTVLSLLGHDSGLILAGSAFTGVYRSTDRGTSWKASNGGLPAGVVAGLALGRAGTNVLLGTGDALYYSTNDGLTWSPTILQSGAILGVAADDGYAYADYVTGFSSSDGIYRSTDQGLSWTRVFYSLSTSYVAGMAADGPYVYAAIYTGGMLRSTDHGSSWGSVGPGGGGLSVYSLHVSGNELFAGTDPAGARVYRSTDHGGSWQTFGGGIPVEQAVEALTGGLPVVFAATEDAGVWRRPRTASPLHGR